MPTGLERRYNEETARKIDDAVRELIDKAFEKAVSILKAEPGVRRQPGGKSLTPCALYTTADGWIFIMCIRGGRVQAARAVLRASPHRGYSPEFNIERYYRDARSVEANA